MIYKRNNLQQLWEVKVFIGDREAKKPETEKLTVIAWNGVDVARKIGDRLVEQPKSLGHVWQDPKTQQYQIIEDTSGPTGKTVKPTVAPDA